MISDTNYALIKIAVCVAFGLMCLWAFVRAEAIVGAMAKGW